MGLEFACSFKLSLRWHRVREASSFAGHCKVAAAPGFSLQRTDHGGLEIPLKCEAAELHVGSHRLGSEWCDKQTNRVKAKGSCIASSRPVDNIRLSLSLSLSFSFFFFLCLNLSLSLSLSLCFSFSLSLALSLSLSLSLMDISCHHHMSSSQLRSSMSPCEAGG